jgi:hypothetical protein
MADEDGHGVSFDWGGPESLDRDQRPPMWLITPPGGDTAHDLDARGHDPESFRKALDDLGAGDELFDDIVEVWKPGVISTEYGLIFAPRI